MKKISIDGKFIGNNCPFYIIAEAGANHDGQIEKAYQLIDAAVQSKVDAIKFQNYTASKLTTKTAQKYWNDGKPFILAFWHNQLMTVSFAWKINKI